MGGNDYHAMIHKLVFIKNNIKYFFKTNIICMSRNYFPIPIVCNLLPFLFMLNIIFTFLNHIIQ